MVYLVLKRFGIQSILSLEIVNIDDIAYKKFSNVSINDMIRDKLFENNDMLRSIHTE